jgi:hypothetical protein
MNRSCSYIQQELKLYTTGAAAIYNRSYIHIYIYIYKPRTRFIGAREVGAREVGAREWMCVSIGPSTRSG